MRRPLSRALSESNAQAALKAYEEATRVALSRSEDERATALLRSAADAHMARAANDIDREAALVLAAKETAIAW